MLLRLIGEEKTQTRLMPRGAPLASDVRRTKVDERRKLPSVWKTQTRLMPRGAPLASARMLPVQFLHPLEHIGHRRTTVRTRNDQLGA